MSNGLKRFLVFVCGVPGYLLTFAPWLFSFGILSLLVIERYRPDYAVLEIEDIPSTALTSNTTSLLPLAVMSVGLWLFAAWMTKQVLLLIAGLFGDDQKTWLFVRFGGLVIGWAFVLVLAVFVFESVSSGFLLSELVIITAGLVSFTLEHIAYKILLRKSA